jgi:uncharacterized protein YqeY|tara:strand:- start:72 stop:470 length:399 start_codon:yes stop_codon:yes gene_type:complete
MSNLKNKISKDFMDAFKAKDLKKKNFLGVIRGEIQLQEGRGVKSTDENVLQILKKMEKSLKQTDTEESRKEINYITPYLPTQMSEVRIREIVTNYMNDGLDSIGKIMGEFNKNFKGQADNKVVSEVIKSILN